ncbi:MAG: hypothetical protein L7S64_11375 [Longimicrobiales bacterium]|nr:hypothetical protein [Longimicrobiales bacterium]
MNAPQETAAIDKFATVTHRYGLRGGDFPSHLWPGLYFTRTGEGRLMNIAGYIVGLHQSGKEELANKLAESLDSRLTYLGSYGGKREFETPGTPSKVSLPEWRVFLGDDGTFGGFTVSWYRVYSFDFLREQAEEYLPRLASHYPDYIEHWDDDAKWAQALADTRKRNGIPDKTSEIHKACQDYRTYAPDWVVRAREQGETGLCNDYFMVEYGYSHNGGLLLHGMGHETFSVDLSNDTGPHWSVHT